jgi:hypothetical protein
MIRVAKAVRDYDPLFEGTLTENEKQRRIVSRLIEDAAVMKDASFKEEKEVRLVAINALPTVFSSHRYGIVPRVTINIPEGALESVTVGPSANQDLRCRSLVDYFSSRGFKGSAPSESKPNVMRSRIPFRNW